MEAPQYPVLFQEADCLAAASQRNHLRLLRSKIAVLIVVGVIAAIAWEQEVTLRIIAGASLIVLLVLSISLTAIAREKHFEETWFGSRAIAELVKGETWTFMMRTKPYDAAVPENETENFFLNRLREILHTQPGIFAELSPHWHEGVQITQSMRQVRAEGFEKRKEYYIQNRLRDQMLWYLNKAIWNRKQVSRWLVITWILEILAVAFAVFITIFPLGKVSPVGIILAASTGVLSWLNAKSYTEAAQSYGLVAEELDILQEKARQTANTEELSKTVSDAENVINQEHRVWLGRVI